jgi:hypothetical protein
MEFDTQVKLAIYGHFAGINCMSNRIANNNRPQCIQYQVCQLTIQPYFGRCRNLTSVARLDTLTALNTGQMCLTR